MLTQATRRSAKPISSWMSFVEVVVRQMSVLSLAVWSLYSTVPIANVLCGPAWGAGGGHNLGEIEAGSLFEAERLR